MYKPMATYNKESKRIDIDTLIFSMVVSASVSAFILTFISWWVV